MCKFKSVVMFSLLLTSTAAMALCPDPLTQCPALGSSLAEAKQCGWQVKNISPYDPLTQYVLFGQPFGPGPSIDNYKHISSCVYAASLDTNPLSGFLIHSI